MSSKWEQDWFIERTSPPTVRTEFGDDELAQPKVLPIFWCKSFSFLPGEEPEHIQTYPFFSIVPDSIEIYGRTREGSFYPLAMNVRDLATASLLVHARIRRLEAAYDLFKSTDDVCVLREDGTLEYRYIGKSEQ